MKEDSKLTGSIQYLSEGSFTIHLRQRKNQLSIVNSFGL